MPAAQKSLLEMTPGEKFDYIMAGGKVPDPPAIDFSKMSPGEKFDYVMGGGAVPGETGPAEAPKAQEAAVAVIDKSEHGNNMALNLTAAAAAPSVSAGRLPPLPAVSQAFQDNAPLTTGAPQPPQNISELSPSEKFDLVMGLSSPETAPQTISVPVIDKAEHGNNMALNLNVPPEARDPLHIGAAAQNAYWNLQEAKGNTEAMRAFQLEQAKRENTPGGVVAVNRSGIAPMTPVEEAVMLRQMAAKDRGDTEKAAGLEKSFDYRVDELKENAKRLWEAAEKGKVKYDLPDNKFGAAILQTIESSGMTVEAALRTGMLWALGGPALGLMGSLVNTATESDYEGGEAFMTALRAGKSPEEIQAAVDFVQRRNFGTLLASNPLGDVLLFGMGKPLKALAAKIGGKGLLAKAGKALLERGIPYVGQSLPEGVEGGSQEAYQQQAAGQDLDWKKIKEAAGSEALASLLYGLVGRGIRGGANVLLGSQEDTAESDGGKPGTPPTPPPVSGEAAQADGAPLPSQERVRQKLLDLREKIFSSYLGPGPHIKGAAPELNWDNMSSAMKKQVLRLRKAMDLWDTGKYDEAERLTSLLKDEMMPEKDTPLWAPVSAETAEEPAAEAGEEKAPGQTAEPSMPISEAADQVLAAPPETQTETTTEEKKAGTIRIGNREISIIDTDENGPTGGAGGGIVLPGERRGRNTSAADTSIPTGDTSISTEDTSTPRKRVKGRIRSQLEGIAAQGGEQGKVMGSEEIEAYSTLFAAMAEQAGKRQGISADEWLDSQNLKIVNGRPEFEASDEGTKLDQPLNDGVDSESTMTGFVAQPRFTAEQALELRSGKRRVDFIKSVSGKYQNEDTGWNINLSNKNVSHAIASAVKNNEVDLATSMNILAELPKIIQHARLVESHEDQKQKGYVDKIHRFFVPSKISNDPKAMYKVKLTVKELAGHFETSIEGIYRAYDARIIEKVSERRHRKGLKDQPLNSHTPDTFEIILGPFLEGVKDSEGNPYIEGDTSLELKQNAGVNSKTAPRRALERAKQMERAGKRNARDIYAETGWFKGPDGEWRYVIDDSKASITPAYKNAAAKLKLAAVTKQDVKVSDLLDHPDLYAAYPHLKDMKVSVNINRAGGSYQEGNYPLSMELGTNSLNNEKIPARDDELLETLLHEIQHSIQGAEGFNRGGNMQMVQARMQALWDRKDDPDLTEEEREAARNELNRLGYSPDEKEFNPSRQTIFDAYRRIGGEAEARLTSWFRNVRDKKNRLPNDAMAAMLKSEWLMRHNADLNDVLLKPNRQALWDFGTPWSVSERELFQGTGETSDSSSQGPVADEITTRGSTLFGKSGVTITLGKTMDRSTLVHEFGHLFLQDLYNQAKNGIKDAIRDATAILNWWIKEAGWLAVWIRANKYGTFTAEQAALFAGKNGAQLVRDALSGKADAETTQIVMIAGYEMFAHGFERYLSDGKAPNAGLQAVFERFKTWLADVYGKLAGDPNFKLSKEAREVMDRMVGGESSAAQAGTAENVSVTRNGNQTVVTLNEMELFQRWDESGQKVFRSVSENIASGKRGMEKVIRDHADVMDAMVRDDIGSVSFYWGTPGTGSTFKGGSGVSHIIAKRNSEGFNGEETARKMVDVIGLGNITKTEGPEKGIRVTISKDGYSAVLSLYRMGEKNTWLLTGWKDWDGNENSPGVNEEVYDSSKTTLPEPTRFQSKEGAGEETDDILSPEEKIFQSSEKKKTKQQQALTHKAEETEQARKLSNAPENPWPDEGSPISEQDIEDVFGTRNRAAAVNETPWPGEGENITEADIDNIFSEGPWSTEGFSSAVREIDDFFTPETKKRGGGKGPSDPKNRERYDREGNLLSENTKDETYLNPIYTLTSPSLLAKKNKLFTPFFTMAKEAQELQETLRRDFNAILDKAWGDLSDDQSQALNEILIEGDLRGRTLTDEQLTARGLDEKVRKGYRLIRDLSDRVGRAVRQRQRESGTTVMGWREGYVPHIFHGFFVRLDGRIVDTARSLQEAVELARSVEKKHPGGKVDIASKPNDFSGSSAYNASALNDRKLLKFSTTMEEAFTFTPDEAETFLKGKDKGAFKNRIFAFSHERLGIKGWDQDMRFAFRHYVNQSARFLAMDELKYRGLGLFEKTWGNFKHEYNGIAKYTKDYLNDVLGVPSNASTQMNEWFKRIPGMYKISKQVFGDRPAEYLASVFTKGMGVAKLGFLNMASAMMNLSQLINASALLGYNDLRLGIQEYFANLRNPSERVTRIYEETGVSENLNVAAGAGYSKASEKMYGAVGRFLELSMAPFAYMDGMCRKATVLAAYTKAIREGKNHKDAIAYAKEINDRANFDYSVADTPAFLRRSGPLGQVIFQFKKFGIKQLELATGLNGFAQNARFWIPMIALSGLWGFPGAELLKSLFMALFGRDPQAEVNAWMAKQDWIPEPVRRTIQYGLLSNAGIDISKRVGMGDVIPNELADLLGPTAGTIARMAGPVATMAGKLFGLEGDGTAALLNAIEALSPGLSNPIKAILGEVEDKKRGRLKFKYEGSERVVRAMGFRPTREAVESDAVRTANYVEAKRMERERDAIDEYVRARESGSSKDAAKALQRLKELKITPDRIIRELRERKKGTAYERLQQRLKGQKSQEAREILQGF